MPEPEAGQVPAKSPPPMLAFRDPVHMLAAIDPLLALAAVHPSAAVVAASNLMDFFSPAQNPAAALMAFQIGWDATRGREGGPDPGGLLALALLGRLPGWAPWYGGAGW